jgi:hypothetical protein
LSTLFNYKSNSGRIGRVWKKIKENILTKNDLISQAIFVHPYNRSYDDLGSSNNSTVNWKKIGEKPKKKS